MNDQRPSPWERLFRIACDLIDQTNKDQEIIDHWTFGGGTAMMLQLDHRESHDVDIFLPDPQLLPFLDPAKHDFDFEIRPADYTGDGHGFQKIAFPGIGEIDFIVASSLTANPTIKREVEGRLTLLETLPEIITKKVYHRGASIKARDLFDIAAAGNTHRREIIAALALYPDRVAATLTAMEKLKPEFVRDAISALMIKNAYKDLAGSAFEKAKEILLASQA